jgi:hypothetical protein
MKKVKKKISEKKETPIRSMEELQKEYFPSLVGKKCPYCGKDIEQNIEKESWNQNT